MFIENSNHEIIILCDYGRRFVVLTTYCVHTYHITSIKNNNFNKNKNLSHLPCTLFGVRAHN